MVKKPRWWWQRWSWKADRLLDNQPAAQISLLIPLKKIFHSSSQPPKFSSKCFLIWSLNRCWSAANRCCSGDSDQSYMCLYVKQLLVTHRHSSRPINWFIQQLLSTEMSVCNRKRDRIKLRANQRKYYILINTWRRWFASEEQKYSLHAEFFLLFCDTLRQIRQKWLDQESFAVFADRQTEDWLRTTRVIHVEVYSLFD